MADSLTLVNTHPSGQAVRKDGYRSESLQEVRARASIVSQETSAEELRSLRRLNQVLDQEQPPRGSLPRGFYLNIEV